MSDKHLNIRTQRRPCTILYILIKENKILYSPAQPQFGKFVYSSTYDFQHLRISNFIKVKGHCYGDRNPLFVARKSPAGSTTSPVVVSITFLISLDRFLVRPSSRPGGWPVLSAVPGSLGRTLRLFRDAGLETGGSCLHLHTTKITTNRTRAPPSPHTMNSNICWCFKASSKLLLPPPSEPVGHSVVDMAIPRSILRSVLRQKVWKRLKNRMNIWYVLNEHCFSVYTVWDDFIVL